MSRERLLKVGRGAAIAGAGAALAYLFEALPGLDLGLYGPAVAGILAVFVNYLRQLGNEVNEPELAGEGA